VLLHTALAPFRSFVEEQTGLTGEIVLGGDSIALGKKLHDDQVQLGVFHGHEFAWAQTKYPKLEALVVCAIKGRDSRVVLVVRKDSKYRSVADLRGKVASLPRMNRGYCRLYFEKHCVCPGMTPEKYYARILMPFDIEDGLNHVVTRKSACAIVDALALEEYGKAFPARARYLRVLQESDPFPGGVLACYNGRFPAAEARRLQGALVAAKDTEKGKKALRSLRLIGFVAPPEDHATTLETILKAYPPPGK
jgi:ABC-type phosphate/phosphonate transport system substrate-binding protein